VHSRGVAWGKAAPLATLLLLALIVAGPLWGPGLLNTRGGGDSPFLLLRVHQLRANLKAGVFPARWMPDAAYGFGYPFFNYYSALPYYLAAGLTLIGLDILSAIKLTQTLFFAAAALGMYGWARRALHSRAGGWLTAAAYTLAPYHLVNVYVRGDSLSEFAAFAFYPLILWGLDHLAARPGLRRTIPPALAYAALISTHNLSALIFSPFALLYLAALTWRSERQRWRVLASGLGALGLGILLSTWCWLPTLAETRYGQLEVQTTGYFFYGGHFRGSDLVQPQPIFEYTNAPNNPASFAAIGSAQAALALAGVVVSVAGWARARSSSRSSPLEAPRWTFYLVGLILSTWLITPLSRPLWDHAPLLPMIQFPWRFLSILSLFAALFAGTLVTPLRRRWRLFAAAALAALLALAGLGGLRPEYLPITAAEASVERLQLYELFTENIGSTIRYEYLPRWVTPRPFTGPALFDPQAPPRAIPLNGELMSAEERIDEPTRRVWAVEAGASGAAAAFPLYYWPGWRAAVDGSPAEVRAAADSGYLTLTIPPGRHRVTMRLGRTPLRAVAEAVSAATTLALLAVAVASWRRIASIKPFISSHLPSLACYLLFCVCLASLVAFGPRLSHSGESDLTMDFGRMPYLHHNPNGVELEKWRLIGYRYSASRLTPGATLHVTLDWETERETANVKLQLVSPAAIRRDELPAVAEATAPITSGSGSLSLDLPIARDLGPGLYLVRLESEARPIYLRPMWIGAERAEEEPVLSTFANGALRLHEGEAAQNRPDGLDLRLDWSAAQAVAANYKLSLRLADAAGSEWARLDKQPGYGFLPTSLWPRDRLIHDRYTLSLPEGAPPGEGYTLTLILYSAATGESLGEHAFPVSLNQATMRPDAPVSARFGDELALSRLEAPKSVSQGESLGLTAYWLALRRPSANYVAEWKLETTEQIISATRELAPGSQPTTWPAGAWIAGRASLSVPPSTPPGDYTLSLTLRDPASGASPGARTLDHLVRVQERKRVWELPEMQQEVGARFGELPSGAIELAGYDLTQEKKALRLTLHWRALDVPDRHYKFFVHLADPATGRPVTQVDGMPREFAYPTGMWASGEVVSDEVVLSLEGVPAGEYELAVGWYDPETKQRLPAADKEGVALPDDRLILPQEITLR